MRGTPCCRPLSSACGKGSRRRSSWASSPRSSCSRVGTTSCAGSGLGVGIAVALCAAVAIALRIAEENLPQKQQEGLETVIGLAAVAMVTWMIVWMRKHARGPQARPRRQGRRRARRRLGRHARVHGVPRGAPRRARDRGLPARRVPGLRNPAAAGTGARLGVIVAIADRVSRSTAVASGSTWRSSSASPASCSCSSPRGSSRPPRTPRTKPVGSTSVSTRCSTSRGSSAPARSAPRCSPACSASRCVRSPRSAGVLPVPDSDGRSSCSSRRGRARGRHRRIRGRTENAGGASRYGGTPLRRPESSMPRGRGGALGLRVVGLERERR